METIIYERNCPKCNKILKTKNKYYYKSATEKNTLCLSCKMTGKIVSETAKQNMRLNHADFGGEKNPFYNKTHTAETKRKCGECNVGMDRFSADQKIEMSEKNSGTGNPFYGKKHTAEVKKLLGAPKSPDHIKKIADANRGRKVSDETKIKISIGCKGKKKSVETRIRMSIANKGKERMRTRLGIPCTDEHRRKIRVGHINRRISLFGENNCGPNVGRAEVQYFTQMEKEKNWNGIFHGKNETGRQYHIKHLGYFVDYYEPTHNIVVEYDETAHYDKNWKLHAKDVNRQTEIKNYLKCKFFRYNEA